MNEFYQKQNDQNQSIIFTTNEKSLNSIENSVKRFSCCREKFEVNIDFCLPDRRIFLHFVRSLILWIILAQLFSRRCTTKFDRQRSDEESVEDLSVCWTRLTNNSEGKRKLTFSICFVVVRLTSIISRRSVSEIFRRVSKRSFELLSRNFQIEYRRSLLFDDFRRNSERFESNGLNFFKVDEAFSMTFDEFRSDFLFDESENVEVRRRSSIFRLIPACIREIENRFSRSNCSSFAGNKRKIEENSRIWTSWNIFLQFRTSTVLKKKRTENHFFIDLTLGIVYLEFSLLISIDCSSNQVDSFWYSGE